MKAFVHVALKKTVLDPQGQTIHEALTRLGFSGITGLRQGKLFEIELQPGIGREAARRQVEQAARDVLTNPVIEEYSIHLAQGSRNLLAGKAGAKGRARRREPSANGRARARRAQPVRRKRARASLRK